MTNINLKINGKISTLDINPWTTLLDGVRISLSQSNKLSTHSQVYNYDE
jgi:aerobic-type carbon monoxide dehydrogenase small subunit (CoxS/CutS family)